MNKVKKKIIHLRNKYLKNPAIVKDTIKELNINDEDLDKLKEKYETTEEYH